MSDDRGLCQSIEDAIMPFGFRRAAAPASVQGVEVVAAWVRKTWNTNRGVVVLRLPEDGRSAGRVAQAIKMPLGKALGYFPFFYGIGLQVVCIGRLERAGDLRSHVDALDNQRSILQSLFVVDPESGEHASARTWAQLMTGSFQDAIEGALKRRREGLLLASGEELLPAPPAGS